LVLLALFMLPLAGRFFVSTFFPTSSAAPAIYAAAATSPIATSLSLPLEFDWGRNANQPAEPQFGESLFGLHVGFAVAYNALLLGAMMWLFHNRWRVAQ